MISGKDYIHITEVFFYFLKEEFGFREPTTTDRENLFYDVEYKKENLVISISYENREDHFQVTLFKTKNGISDYDDKNSTIHLSALNKEVYPVLTQKDFEENNTFFTSTGASSVLEKRMLKAAKELRLCLKHMI